MDSTRKEKQGHEINQNSKETKQFRCDLGLWRFLFVRLFLDRYKITQKLGYDNFSPSKPEV